MEENKRRLLSGKDVFLIVVIVIQAIWGSCERKSMQRQYSKHWEDQKEELVGQMKAVQLENKNLIKQFISLQDSFQTESQKIVYITQRAEALRS